MGVFLALTAIAGLAAGVNAQTCTPLAEAASEAGLNTVAGSVVLVSGLPGAEGLVSAVTATEETAEKITLFAPTDEAFEMIGDVVAMLSPEEILNVLLNHVVSGDVPAAAIVDAIADAAPAPAVLETLLGTYLEATKVGDDVMVTPEGTDIMSKVITTDVVTCAGVVHVVDTVLVPAAASGMAPMMAPKMAPAAAPEGVEGSTDRSIELEEGTEGSGSGTMTASVAGVLSLASAAVLLL